MVLHEVNNDRDYVKPARRFPFLQMKAVSGCAQGTTLDPMRRLEQWARMKSSRVSENKIRMPEIVVIRTSDSEPGWP